MRICLAMAALLPGLFAPAAARAEGAAAREVRVWNAPPWQWISAKDEGARVGPVGPLDLRAPRNGVASGQVVVSAAEEFGGLAASVSDLRSASGAALPASAVRIRYGWIGKPFVPLMDVPAASAKVHTVWVVVRVPRQAAPGRYAGRLTIRGPFAPAAVPVELTVYGWTVGDPRDWKTWVNLLQSPESVAGQYGVPLWSDRHFALMEKSFALMAEAGNDVLGVSAVGKTVFGDDPLVLFRKAGPGPADWEPDLGYLERYLSLYDRHAGEPKFFSLHVWNYGMYQSGAGRDGGDEERRAAVIPIAEIRGGRPVPAEMPMYGEPGSEAVWKKVFQGLRGVLDRVGWKKVRLFVGTGGDASPAATDARFFRQVAPEATWRVLTHGGGCPRWGPTALERTQPNGMVVGCLEIARRIPNFRPPMADFPVTCNSRDNVGADPYTYRALAAVTDFKALYDGICWKGVDYWTYTTPEGTPRNALNTYVHFGNMVGGTPRAMAAPGPDGAAMTQQFQMLCEGLQDCEAMVAIREALEVLYPPPILRCDVLQLNLAGALVRVDDWRGGKPQTLTARDLELSLYWHNGMFRGEAQAKATTYNTGKREASVRQVRGSGDAEVFEADVTIADDAWIKGGRGTYRLQVRRLGDACTGTYSGTFNGQDRQGAVAGVFVPNGAALPTGAERPTDERRRRSEAAIEALVARYDQGKAAGGWADLLDRLYATATELTDAARTVRPGAG
jgi:hypothetical protein